MSNHGKNMQVDVLVVDDVEAIRTYLRVLLLKLGFQCVDTASTSQQTMEALRKKHYDLIFLDINLPGADGLSVLRWVTSKYPDIQVVMCTGNSTAQNVKDAISLGAKGFLAKPIIIQSFLMLLHKLGFETASFEQ